MKKTGKTTKAICLLNFSGRYGGAEKRYAALYDYLSRGGSKYFLIINRRLYTLFLANGLLQPAENIVVFNDGGTTNAPEKSRSQKMSDVVSKNHSSFRRFLGRWKYFLKTLVLWLRFSMFFLMQVRRKHINKIYGVWHGGIWIWMWCRWLGIELVYSVNASEKLMLYREMTSFFDTQYHVLQRADRLDFLSPSLAEVYHREMGRRMRGEVLVTPNSFVDYSKYYPVYPKEPHVVFLGRMEPLKNPGLFLEAVEILQRDASSGDTRYYMMGAGRLLPFLQEESKNRGLQNLVFTGLHPRPAQILRSASVFVSLQSSENYPSQALLEAMACECGVVATDVGDTRRLLSEKEGILVSAGAHEIARAIRKFLDQPFLREKLGRNAREKVLEEHTVERFAGWFTDVMEGNTGAE
ncbi:MAG: glycosyltransferase family 4 protein [Marinilabilia sp.]